jgi:hypothetical protein
MAASGGAGAAASSSRRPVGRGAGGTGGSASPAPAGRLGGAGAGAGPAGYAALAHAQAQAGGAAGEQSPEMFVSHPRWGREHTLALAGMTALVLFGSLALSWFDTATLKPSNDMPAWLKSVSHWSNLPIKLGLVHVFLYGVELWHDPRSGERHVGQRLTTLWLQLIEDPRFGQHLHMQLETLLQLCDVRDRQRRGLVARYPLWVQVGFLLIGLVMAVTNLVTSCCYHSLREQLIGLALAVAKLAAFDYLRATQDLNLRLGELYTIPGALVAGVALLVALVALVWLTGADKEQWRLVLHPTTLATVVLVGCALAKALHLARGAPLRTGHAF